LRITLRPPRAHQGEAACRKRDERDALCAAIEEKTGAAEAGAVGKTAIFYRQHAEPKKRTIELPEPKTKPAA
jgi:RNA-binding protein YhbY